MSVKKLKKYSQMVNLVDELTDEQKYEIQHKAKVYSKTQARPIELI